MVRPWGEGRLGDQIEVFIIFAEFGNFDFFCGFTAGNPAEYNLVDKGHFRSRRRPAAIPPDPTPHRNSQPVVRTKDFRPGTSRKLLD